MECYQNTKVQAEHPSICTEEQAKPTIRKIQRTSIAATKLPETRKFRVAAYCRVSTEMETQQTSIQTQMDVFERRIREHAGWEFAGIYADELSGTSAKKRPEFMRMMRDAEEGKIDCIIAKSLSRFARNTLDCLTYLRQLQAWGVRVLFEKEHIDTGSAMSEMLLTVLAAFAQEESRSISENVKWGLRKSFEKGEVRWTKLYGYQQGWEIDPEEAEIVRRMTV